MKFMPGDVIKVNKFIGVVVERPANTYTTLKDVYFCTMMFKHGRFSAITHFKPNEVEFIGTLAEFGIEWEGPFPDEKW